jgi:hypothetical protein
MQVWVYGDSLRDYIIGFFVIDPLAAKKYCDGTNKTQDAALMDDVEFKQAVYDDLIALAVANKLNGLEKCK